MSIAGSDFNAPSGVTQIIAGTGITITPTSGEGAVTINGPVIVSIGGTGVATLGGELATLNSLGALRNILDDGSGNATVAGTLTASWGIILGAVLQVSHGFKLPVSTQTTTYSILGTDFAIMADATGGAFTVTTPTGLATVGWFGVVQKVDASANAVTVAPAAGTIDGAASISLPNQYDAVVLLKVAAARVAVIANNAGTPL